MIRRIKEWRHRRAWIKAWREAIASGLSPAVRAEYQARLDRATGKGAPGVEGSRNG